MSYTHRYYCRAVCAKCGQYQMARQKRHVELRFSSIGLRQARLACMRTAALSLIRSLILVLSSAFSSRRSCRLGQRWRSAQFLRLVSGLSLLMLQEECLRAGGLDAHALILGSLAVAVVQHQKVVEQWCGSCMLAPHSCEGVLCLTSSEK